PRPSVSATSLGVGFCAFFVAFVNLIRALRPGVLLDPDVSWALPRLLLGLFVVAVAAAAGVVAAGFFYLWSRTRLARRAPRGLPPSRPTLVLLALVAIAAGVLLRFVALDRVPWPVFIDESSLVAPALHLEGRLCDFRDSIRPAPYR